MVLICFRCQSSGEGEGGACSSCGFPLIARAAEPSLTVPWVALDELLERTEETPLPGVSPEPRKAQLLMERRRRRAAEKARAAAEAVEAEREAAELKRRNASRRRLFVGEIFAAGALAALGLLFTLEALGALR